MVSTAIFRSQWFVLMMIMTIIMLSKAIKNSRPMHEWMWINERIYIAQKTRLMSAQFIARSKEININEKRTKTDQQAMGVRKAWKWHCITRNQIYQCWFAHRLLVIRLTQTIAGNSDTEIAMDACALPPITSTSKSTLTYASVCGIIEIR